MNEEKTIKRIENMRKNNSLKNPQYKSRRERVAILCKVGALIDMLGLAGEDTNYLVGLLLQHFTLNEEEKNILKKNGKIFLDKREELKRKG